MRDNQDVMVKLLNRIEENTRDIESGGQEINITGQTAASRVGVIEPQNYLTRETDDLPNAKSDGSITVDPGESQEIVEYVADAPSAVLAIGASDHIEMEYTLDVDYQTTVGGRTNSPLGQVNDPFSFVEKMSGAIPVEKHVQYTAHLPSTAPGPIDVVGRIHIEVL